MKSWKPGIYIITWPPDG